VLSVVVIIVVLAKPEEGNDIVTQQGLYLQFQTFDAIVKGVGAARVRIYTMAGRMVHAKFFIADDQSMCVGSANASIRSFQMDSELNIHTATPALISAFRSRLWAHNLGVSAATVASWGVADFLGKWDAVANSNAALALKDMVGEGVIPFDYTKQPGNSHVYVPDEFTELDLSPEPTR
jgi:hypothetical protein